MSPRTKRWLASSLVVAVELAVVSILVVRSIGTSHPPLSGVLWFIGFIGLGVYGLKYILLAVAASGDTNTKPFYAVFKRAIIVDVIWSAFVAWMVWPASGPGSGDAGFIILPIVFITVLLMAPFTLAAYKSEKKQMKKG